MGPDKQRLLAHIGDAAAAYFGSAADDRERAAILECAFLMAAADGDLGEAERLGLVEAVFVLSRGQMPEEHIAAALDAFVQVLAQDGWEARIATVADHLRNPGTRRNAFRLAACVSFIDGEVQEPEERLFGMLAEAFGIGADEATAILAEMRDAMFGPARG